MRVRHHDTASDTHSRAGCSGERTWRRRIPWATAAVPRGCPATVRCAHACPPTRASLLLAKLKRCVFCHNPVAAHTAPRLRAADTLQGVPPSCCVRRAAEWSGVCSNRLSGFGAWRSGTTGKQPANLAVESTEESLTILPDYTTTVRPPPKRS
jgi:hypothetical protein